MQPIQPIQPTSGMLVAALAKGAQDAWVEKNGGEHSEEKIALYDAHTRLLKNKKYQVGYGKIATTNVLSTASNGSGKLTMTFNRGQCDLVNEVDIVVSGKYLEMLDYMFSRIEVEYGGMRFDFLGIEGCISMQIRTNAEIWKRPVKKIGTKLIIPLTCAPFHPNNLTFPSSTCHDLKVSITFAKGFQPEDVKIDLYGNMYFLHSEEDRTALIENSHELIVTQNQYGNVDTMTTDGENTIKLLFNHPVQVMYLWGLNVNRIRNVRLMLENAPFYDGPIEPLLYKQQQRGITCPYVLAFFFSNDPVGAPTNSSINFSRIDKAELILDTAEVGTKVYIVGLNMQPYRYIKGMVGLVFSK